jgi:hypothetical protein
MSKIGDRKEAKRILEYEDYEVVGEVTEHMEFIGQYGGIKVYHITGSFYVINDQLQILR